MDIKAFERLEKAGNGDNLQGQIRETHREPDGLPAIEAVLSLFRSVMPGRPPRPELVFAAEQQRVEKRNVLFEYVEDKDTYVAEVIETTVTRFPTHEPCVEHLPARFEDEVDPRGRLQDLLSEHVQFRNSEENGGFGV